MEKSNTETLLTDTHCFIYLKQDSSDLHVIYLPYQYKMRTSVYILKLDAIFLIKRKDQFKFMY